PALRDAGLFSFCPGQGWGQVSGKLNFLSLTVEELEFCYSEGTIFFHTEPSLVLEVPAHANRNQAIRKVCIKVRVQRHLYVPLIWVGDQLLDIFFYLIGHQD